METGSSTSLASKADRSLTEDFGEEEFHRVVSINLDGVFFGMSDRWWPIL
ncbi:hypothetical protein [Novosphingobium malaysiense]|nr:hypothetical protein [Novosphingobium malaysiense]